MSTGLLKFLDVFFIVFHTTFTLFNIVGWIWKKTRKMHLITLLLTLFSWIFLGIWYGFGYCFCTDWHWRVRTILGNPPPEDGYIQFLVRVLTGLHPSYEFTARTTVIVTILLLAATLFFNGRDFLLWRLRRRNERELNLMDEEPHNYHDVN
ncbi:MAG: DUF2784 domain-containing protein [Spirochaetales bacterium]|nr:DUF2784 domain-containing protein [Spirochaetales bacterium]